VLSKEVFEIWMFVLTALKRDALETFAGNCTECSPNMKTGGPSGVRVIIRNSLIVYGEMLKIKKAREKADHLTSTICVAEIISDGDF
jgi:hypothetical protein